MSAATLEAPAVATMTELPGQDIALIAADLLIPVDIAVNWLKARSLPVMTFEDKWIGSGDAAIELVNHFSGDIAQRLLARRGLLKPVATTKSMKPDGKVASTAKPSAKTAAKKPAAKKPATKTAAKTAKKSTEKPIAAAV